MDRVVPPFGRRPAPVVENRKLGGYRLIAVEDAAGPAPRAGQFYMLATAERWGAGDGGPAGRPYLPRAISVGAVDRADEGVRLGFLLEDVGPGTHRLTEAQPGEELLVTGPFGRGFSYPEELAGNPAEAVLVAGGVGVPPIAVWESELRGRGVDPVVMAGFRSGELVAGAALFGGSVHVATDDGSTAGGAGEVHAGPVTDLLAARLDGGEAAVVYACGPPAMLEAVRALCAALGVPAELAMEAGMACGFGACFGCVVETESGYIRLCLDGPVVNAATLASVLQPHDEQRSEDAIGVGN